MSPLRQNRLDRSSTRVAVLPEEGSPSRLENIRISIHGLFSGRSSVGRSRRGSLPTPDSPKSPQPAPTLQPVAGLGSRLIIPYLHRSASQSDSRSQSRADSRTGSHVAALPPAPDYQSIHTPDTPLSARPITPTSWGQIRQSNDTTRLEMAHHSPRRFVGVDPAEQRLAALAQDARRRRRQKSRRSDSGRRRCGPKIRNRKIRNKILSCFVSGIVSSKSAFLPTNARGGLTNTVSYIGSHHISRAGPFKPF